MKKLAASLLVLSICAGCGSGTPAEDNEPNQDAQTSETSAPSDTADGTAATTEAPVSLVQLWSLGGFSDPEGVAEGPDGNYFISNVAGTGDAADGTGWISVISPFGEMIEPQFATGLNAPKGMVVDRGVLYVADINQIRMVDAREGTILRTLDVEGAEFLNDMVSWNATVPASDSGTGRIYRLAGDEADVWLEDERLAGANGLTADADRLLIATMDSGSLYEVTAAKDLKEIASGMKNADGIGVIDGGYLVSSWPGQVWFVSDAGETSKVLDTQADGIFQNDLTILNDTVIIPNWRPGTVTAWKVEVE